MIPPVCGRKNEKTGGWGQASVFWYWAAGERRMAGGWLPGTLYGQVRKAEGTNSRGRGGWQR
jgi:hypothetical protein